MSAGSLISSLSRPVPPGPRTTGVPTTFFAMEPHRPGDPAIFSIEGGQIQCYLPIIMPCLSAPAPRVHYSVPHPSCLTRSSRIIR